MNVFLDTNVVVDFMLRREPFFNDASTIFAMVDDKKINASTSVLTVVNCAYLMKKAFSREIVLNKVNVLCETLKITPIDVNQLTRAAKMNPYDYEDAVQYMSALPKKPDIIITRDEKGFREFEIPVMSPSDFVKAAKQPEKNLAI